LNVLSLERCGALSEPRIQLPVRPLKSSEAGT